ncbi:hypothetical protein HYH03_016527 [Edaphochlamys debaryana]|uniref:Phosphodiesterase n=1 Tax=Edaphochlamys debaryana TaxID=47281 RepID=A0A835XIH9_9CHLO|nr:hypothetical protein HYH03_016527 [Edaphochlamys debaryana]|eukprot:KAG2484698.1 hypothetical protein HYH03_016527 [Edaphochlamys debaryana]
MIDQSKILRIQFGEGIAGLVAQTGGSMNLPDVYEHPMFNKAVDRLTGFRTRSMLCMAISDMTGKNVAVLQALNKAGDQAFTAADERNLKLFGTHLGNTLVKAKLHETAKREKARLQAIYTTFKTLSMAEEVGQMVVVATAALEQRIILAERAMFFLVDAPRGELWLHTHQAEPVRLRMGAAGGVVGICAETKKPQSWQAFEDPSSDPALRRIAPLLAPSRIKSVLVQPIHGTASDRVLAVVLAVNKREAEGTNDIFFDPCYTDADLDAMGLFAYEVGDLLSERSLELSLLSALSVVGHDGAHPNVARPGGGGAGEEGGGEGASEPSGAAACGAGDEDLIRTQLISMYLPDYKNSREAGVSHSLGRSSFTAANTHQVRASLERKRSAHFTDGPLKRNSPRYRDTVSASGRLGLALAAAAARSSVWASARAHAARSVGGGMDDGSGLGSAVGSVGLEHAVSGGPLAGPEGSFSRPASDASGDLLLPELGALRCASSSMAEAPLRHRGSGGSNSGAGGGGGGGAGGAAGPASVSSPLLQASRPRRTVSGRAFVSSYDPGLGGNGLGQYSHSPQQHSHRTYQHHSHPHQNKGFARLMAPWRRPLRVAAAAGGGGLGASGSGGPGTATGSESAATSVHGDASDDGRLLEEGDEGDEGVLSTDDDDGPELEHDSDPGSGDGLAGPGFGTGAQGGAAAGGGGGPRDVLLSSKSFGQARSRPGGPPARATGGSGTAGAEAGPWAQAGLEEELRAAEEATLHPGVANPQALRTHLSCSNLAATDSLRTPCFHPEELLLSWEWDFTQAGTEELIKLAYDIFIVSGAIEEFGLKPKVLRNFLTAVASHYHDIPYHNFNHVCHVLHATYLITCTTTARAWLKPLERLSVLLSALCHDLDHDGHSNSFHVNSSSELARIYNDQSVMENHHCAMSFAILSRNDCNVLGVLSPEEQRAARKIIISCVLCTDMANHFALTQEFQKHNVVYDPESESDRLLFLKVALHAADIGNAVRPFHVNHAMSRRVHREFESQAEEEVRMGLPVTFAVDTADHVMCARVELNFLDYVVTTLWERLVDVLPELAPRLQQLKVNRTRYRRIADTGKTSDQVLAEEAEAAAAAAAAEAAARASEALEAGVAALRASAAEEAGDGEEDVSMGAGPFAQPANGLPEADAGGEDTAMSEVDSGSVQPQSGDGGPTA